MLRSLIALLTALALTGCTTAPPERIATAPQAARGAPLLQLVGAVDIPYERFTLANGLEVLVHTDRKAPIVGVTTYYRVGSKHEPRGKTGFAHLYEHLFFGGSENVPNFDTLLEGVGSVPTNGSTWYDRTNYVETVPTGALEVALFAESDRMGHLLGAVTQEKLDAQRGVVQNEKRQGDNQPYGLTDYAIGEGLFPVGHPYRHATIGSMADLSAASLADVRQWYRDNYGPNNAVLALTGDIDAATARPLVEKWFGHIAAGPEVRQPAAAPVTLTAPVKREMTDQVPVTRIYRAWSGPGLNDPEYPALDVALRVLGGLASSRLDNALVRGEELAVRVTASAQAHEQISFLEATMDVKPGIDRALAEARFDALIAHYIEEGPSEDEVRRAATGAVSAQIGALERVGGMYGKGATLAEGLLYSGDPAHYRTELARIAAVTPGEARAAMQKWLKRPVFALAVSPGDRTESGEGMGGWGDEANDPTRQVAPPRPALPLAPGIKREAPPVAAVHALEFPTVERARLSNGIPVALARRTAVPKVLVSIEFAGGFSADFGDKPGTQALMLELLDEGTATRNATQIAEEKERLGASIELGTGIDASAASLSALSANLAPSLALLADLVRNPAFRTEDVARARAQQLAALDQTLATPQPLAQRMINPILFGSAHPYGLPGDGLGDRAALASLDAAALRASHARSLRPDLARITVVGDVTLSALLPLLERAFGDWQATGAVPALTALDAPVPAPRPRIVLVDRPNSPQSVIVAGRVLPLTGRSLDTESLELANEVLGDGFLSRLMSDLREEKGWSYGLYSGVPTRLGPRPLLVVAPVQADRTGDSIRRIIANMKDLPANRPVAPGEVARVTEGNIRGLPNRFETNAQVLSAIVLNDRLGRPDDYYSTVADKWRRIDATALNAAAARYLQPEDLTYVVVGDRKVVEPQLAGIGLPVEIAAPVDSAPASD